MPKTSPTAPLPDAWMPPCVMRGVVAHWSAGGWKASGPDLEHYHVVVEGDGVYVLGEHPISDNVNCADDDYAAHTRSCNTGFIGISCASMRDAVERPFKAGPAPTTKVQWDRMCAAIAQFCTRYKIPVSPRTVLTHAEVQGTLGIAQRGKWDFTRLAFDSSVIGAKACGDRMRADVLKAMAK